MSQFKATETFFVAESDSPIFKGAILSGDNPVVKAHPNYFTTLEEAAARDENAVYENATAAPNEVRKTQRRKPKADDE
jgi:hypothetical protein